MSKKLIYLITLLLTMTFTAAVAQVTTSAMSGKVTAGGETIIGATVSAKHVPSGTVYRAVTNTAGRYSITGMRPGGPYEVEITYIGYQGKKLENVSLSLAQTIVVDANLKEGAELLDEVVVSGSKQSNMRNDRSGAVTSIDLQRMEAVPTISRSMTDMIRLTPQGATTSNGFALGGGNYRQSNVTIDGAQFNNTFGLGSNILPGGGTPISLDALEQMTVSITPYDVRQSGFTGGAINAVTRSGTNKFKGTAYAYLTSNDMRGKNVGDEKLTLESSHNNVYGASFSGPIIKDKLFFFVNGEYEDVVSAGPSARAGGGDNGKYSNGNRRPTLEQLNSLTDYMQKTYGFNTGQWQGFNLKTPSYRLLARIDWNINDNNRFNVRFTKSNRKSNSSASTSRSIGTNLSNAIYGGSNSTYGSNSYYGMASESTRYYAEYRFTSVAAELNSKFGLFNNTLRGTYSYQDQPRSNEYGDQPTVEIVMQEGKNYPTWAMTGNDVFTMGNLSQTKNLVITDELTATLGRHSIIAGLQYEHNKAVNGYAQAASGYYSYIATPEQVAAGDWASVFAGTPNVFAITYGNNDAHSMFKAQLSTNNYAFYLQDNMALTDNFKLSAGVRFELPNYPALEGNYNKAYEALKFGDQQFRTDNVPDNSVSFSPRVGFNWDITGERKYVLRGGTGLFVGRMPFVWLVSAVGNSGMGQTSYLYLDPNNGFYNSSSYANKSDKAPTFTTSQAEMLKQIGATSATSVPGGPTILADDLRMPKTWKSSLAFDAKLPGGIDFTIEGIFNKDFNPCIVTNKNVYWDGKSTVELSKYDTRHKLSTYTNNQAYVVENAGKKAYYWSVNAMLHKKFDFGLDLTASYTRSMAKSYSEGIGDQVSSAYTNYRNSVNAVNDHELGYSTYVAPNRILLQAGYTLNEGKTTASHFGLVYDAQELGYLGGYSYTRYSYIFASNVNNDASAPGNLIRIPASRQELNDWNFADNGTVGKDKAAYTADMQRDDFWQFINQDSYLKNHKGEYAQRGGATMPWHHQVDFKFSQDIFMNVKGQKHCLTLGVDIENLPNLLSKNWGLYKQITGNTLLNYKNGAYTYNLVNGARHLTTSQNYTSLMSTYRVMFSVRYTFN